MKCKCLTGEGDGCAYCKKRAINAVRESGRDLNEDIKAVKNGAHLADLYVKVYCVEYDVGPCIWRSAIDILRGDCNYCKHIASEVCKECSWPSESADNDCWYYAGGMT